MLEHRLVFHDYRTILAVEAFRGKLDRRQRILDLVGNAACDVGPGGRALRGDEFGNIIQRDDIAVMGIDRLFVGHTDRGRAFTATAGDGNLSLHQPRTSGVRGSDDFRKLRHHFLDRLAEGFGLAGLDQFFRRTVEDADVSLGVDANDAGAGAGQHGLGEYAAAVDEVAGAHDIIALGAQLLRHFVEGRAELRDIAL